MRVSKHWLPLASLILCATLSGCTPPTPAAPPNILFAIADDASFPHMGAYGTTWVNTPAFDRVAADGLLFMNAYTPNAKCAPSRSAILTGRNSWQLREAANHWPFFPADIMTYAEALDVAGYHVGFTAKGWGPGFANDAEGNPRDIAGKRYSEARLEPPAEHISPIDYTENFRLFLDDREEGQPFTFWYGALEPHRRYEYGAGINKGGKQLSDIEAVPSYWPDTEEVRTDMLDYAYEIEYFDQHLARMLEMLDERGELANTLVVVTADNGMPFPRVKGQGYEHANHLPLAMMWADGIQHPGRRIEDMVSFIDFAPTFLELAGVDPAEAGMLPVTGHSLTDLFEGEGQMDRDFVLIGKERHDIGRPQDAGYPIRGIVKSEYLYLHNFETDRWPGGDPQTGYLNCDGSPTKTACIEARQMPDQRQYWAMAFGKRPADELYNIANDPDCVNNLAGDPALSALMTALKDQLFAELEAQEDPRMAGNGAIFDAYPYSDSRNVNFYERFMSGEELPTGWVNAGDFEVDFEE